MSFWKTKLAAYLHDPPSKCVDIRHHENNAKTLYRQAGFTGEDELQRLGNTYAQPSDWTASSADRFPFPTAHHLSSVFDGKRAKFHHPLSPGQCFEFHREFTSAEAAMEIDQQLQPTAQVAPEHDEADSWKSQFFCHWRLWEKFCAEHDYRFAFLPADTRIPDHTVWTHMQVVSALDSCSDGTGAGAVLKPAFLKLQLGPVQEFIAEARSTRDLWSGSYLLSWLMAAGMKALAMEVGPDAVIFPNLKGQPLFDLHLRDCLWSQVRVNGRSVWDHLQHDPKDLLTPNLPNVFLAVVHQDRAEELGHLVEQAIRNEWQQISEYVWKFLEAETMIPAEEAGLSAAARKQRYDAQVARFLSISWQATPWPTNLDQAMALTESFAQEMPIQKTAANVKAIVDYVTTTMPSEHRDSRYYSDHAKTQLNNIGLGWSVMLAFNGWQLDAVRQTRAFSAWSAGGWESGTFQNKDSLGGKAEAVAGGDRWQRTAAQHSALKSLFKHNDWLGAVTLIKRVWHLAYLKKHHDLPADPANFRMPNTHGIARHEPNSSGDDENENTLPGQKYFAVLALDGDEIGKWVSGERTPQLGAQFSDYMDSSNVQRHGAKVYFENHQGQALLDTHRPLSPSYHLQFSQALSNFALLTARRIVEHHKGRLIYAGGDDVLALLPADTALACAMDLRKAFRGEDPGVGGITCPHPGYLSISKDQSQRPIAFIVPGSQAEVSVGIAVAHFKSPLQDAVRAAQKAEKRAKSTLGRAAVAMTVLKRSGEITEWGTKWSSGGLELFHEIADRLTKESLSAKFPHRICQLLDPYRQNSITHIQDAAEFNAAEIIRKEFEFAITRQSAAGQASANREALMPLLNAYLSGMAQTHKENQNAEHPTISSHELLKAVTGLCTTVAFAHRTNND